MADPHHPARTAHPVVHHEHGSMDIDTHERTFQGFIKFMTWNAVAVILVLIFLALTNA